MLDMERFHHSPTTSSGGSSTSRSRFRGKPPRRASAGREVAVPVLRPCGCGDHLLTTERARVKGNSEVKKQAIVSKTTLDTACRIIPPTPENLSAFRFGRGSCRKANDTPIKMLIDEEVSKETESRQSSPSVIARLMGFDSLPRQQAGHKKKKETVACFQNVSSSGHRENYISYDDHSPLIGTMGQDEVKDVFEVFDAIKIEKSENWPAQKGFSSSKKIDKEMSLIRQKFMDTKHLSTDENLQNYKDFSDAMEVLDSSKDLCLKFLQEPHSLFTKHLQDLQSVPASRHGSHIMVLKSSNVAKYKNSEICRKSDRKAERRTQMRKDASHKYDSDPIFEEHSPCLSHKLSKSKCERKTEDSFIPTRIVVLKPSLEKAQKTARIQSTPETFQLGYQRHRKFRKSGSREVFSEERERQNSPDMDVVVRHKAKGSREIAREVSKHMRHTVTDGSVKLLSLRRSGHHGHENSLGSSESATVMNSESLIEAYGQFDDRIKSFSSSSAYPAETSVSREARKRLSERWTMAHKSQEVGIIGRGSNTLGEMLALAHREMSNTSLDSSNGKKYSGDKLAEKEAHVRWGGPLGISSRVGWKDECSRTLPRSRSPSVSSTIYGSPKLSSRHGAGHSDNCFMLKDVLNLGSSKAFEGEILNQRISFSCRNDEIGCNTSQPSNTMGEENNNPVQEIHVIPDELQNKILLRNFSVEKHVLSESSTSSIFNTRNPVDHTIDADCEDAEMPSITNEEQLPQSFFSTLPMEDEDSSLIDQDSSPNHTQAESLSSDCHDMESANSLNSKEAEQPSPVSVLEPLDGDESSPECFERVCADLQDLRMQLQLLKLESTDTYTEGSIVLSDEDDAGRDCDVLPQMGEILQTFRDEEDRDFTYLLNVLTDSGFHSTDLNMLFTACHSPEFPVGPDVFENLEKMYSQVAWSRTDRKLLFDLINSLLADTFAPSIDPHPWVKPKGVGVVGHCNHLAEELWQSLVRQREEVSGNPADTVLEKDMRWLDIGGDIDVVGREIERMLKDDLLEEVISEMITR